ncbi:MAG: T3SS effector HopA1 family protein [Longimicrobiales bacterium]|nr:T3SS effector HopA1 family protein [Longimicrobiales bacterium]
MNDLDSLRRAVHAVLGLRHLADHPAELATLVYLAVYACGDPGPIAPLRYRRLRSLLVDTVFVRRLFRAVPHSVPSAGWILREASPVGARVEGHGVRALFPDADATLATARPGDRVELPVPALSLGLSPGFVVRRTREDLPDAIGRLYLNLRPRDASWALGPLARSLEREAPVVLKVLAHPAAYRRRDSCVVYVPAEPAATLVGRIRNELETHGISLAEGIPALTGRIAPGIGYADGLDDLGSPSESYGRWVAALLVGAARTERTVEAMVEEVGRQVSAAGRTPEAPFLRGGRTLADFDTLARAGRR